MTVLVVANFPSVAAVFMASAASLLVLVLARIIFLCMRLWSCPLTPAEGHEKSAFFLSLSSKSFGSSLQPSREVGTGIGVGLSQKRSEALPIATWKPRRSGPQFQPPPPALYESPVPLSMAKMIMSRHTFRRPNPNRPRRASLVSASRSTPQTPSRLFHSLP
ncbi:hypothetical protein F5I97DRAFT_166673 [Phlebopus sp. FC_14]|nr:hypothetical protein F5I97DRAFT_166673 [Phlebopus sp. FC_14]